MIGAENKNIHITVFRGGSLNHGESVQEGKDIFSHLKKHNITFSDVYVDEEGNAIKDGVRADMHHTFSNSDGYIDTTGHNNLEHNKLAKKMGLQKLFSEDMSASLSLDRENIYRVLRQNNISVPDTFVVRKDNKDLIKELKKVWEIFHTPLLVRVLVDTVTFPARLIRGFNELVKTVSDFHNEGHDVHILNYKSAPTYSVAVIPKYRGEEFYTPIIVQTLLSKYEVPNRNSPLKLLTNVNSKKKNEISNLAKSTAEALSVKGPVCVDIIDQNGKHIVVNVNLKPSLNFNSRFVKGIESTGVNVGHLIENFLITNN